VRSETFLHETTWLLFRRWQTTKRIFLFIFYKQVFIIFSLQNECGWEFCCEVAKTVLKKIIEVICLNLGNIGVVHPQLEWWQVFMNALVGIGSNNLDNGPNVNTMLPIWYPKVPGSNALVSKSKPCYVLLSTTC
jgi:hypothetical protein